MVYPSVSVLFIFELTHIASGYDHGFSSFGCLLHLFQQRVYNIRVILHLLLLEAKRAAIILTFTTKHFGYELEYAN